MSRICAIALVVCLSWAGPLVAVVPSERPAWCAPPHEMADATPRRPVAETRIDATDYRAPADGPVRFSGNVSLAQFDQLLETEELRYDPETRIVDLPVWLRYTDAMIRIEAASARYRVDDGTGQFDRVRFLLVGHDGSGQAERVAMAESGQARLEGFDFTTCQPERPDWRLKAARVDLDLEDGVGAARHARLEFKGVPVLYSPWMSFPLTDERKSGFLYPSIGYSDGDGFDLSVPWYWNIAPDQDATFTGRWIENRGLMLDTEYRFLTERQFGQLDFEVLPDDRRADDSTRYLGRFDYGARPAPGWNARADLRRVSDDDYFIDLGSDLGDSSVQYLRSVASVGGRGRDWSLNVLADSFQVLDDSVAADREPYRRLPRISFLVDQPLVGGLEWALDSELVYFDRDLGVTGTRADLYPRLAWNRLAPGWFLRPEVGLRATQYQLSGAGADSSPSRTLPIASLDTGLVFERAASGGRTQTLEPRLHYLYVPFRDQDDLPEFDTRELTFGFSQLFHHNRFSSADRQGDANRVALALTSRLLEAADGRSVLEASIGQILHFSDRQVQLPGESVDRDTRSATLVEAAWRPSRALALNAGLQWDSDTSETEVAQFGLNYRDERARQAALGYRFRRDQVDQVDLRFRYPVTRQLNAISRVIYSFEDDDTLEVLGGIEYESCCWALRFTARDYVRDRDGERRTSFFLELELRGLASLGRPPYELFRDRP